MPSYLYHAMTGSGTAMTGTMDADTQAELITRLRGMGYFPTHIEEAVPKEKKGFGGIRIGTGVSQKDIEFFTYQVATLVTGSVPLNRALRICSQQMQNANLRRIVEQVRYDVEHGSAFADALERHPKQFGQLYVNMVRAGQAGGVLGVVLQRLSAFTRQQRELRESVTSALIYPIILMGFVTLIIAVLMFVVIPRFITMFRDMQLELPLTTQILITVVDFVRSPYGIGWLYHGIPLPGAVLTAAIVTVVSFQQYGKTESGKRAMDAFRMRVPVAGAVIRNFALVRFTQTMSTLLDNGVNLLPALQISKDTVGSVVYKDVLERAATEIERGSSLSVPLAESGLFPPLVTDMLAIGEESGKPEAMLERLAEYFDQEIKRSLERLVAAMGPLLILFMAGVVVFIALAIVLPIFNVSKALG